MRNLLGIDIGGTKSAVILGAIDNEDRKENIVIADKITFPTEVDMGVKSTLNRLFESAGKLLDKNNKKNEDIESIGISCGGPLDSQRGIILSPPNLYGWDNIHIVDIIENGLGIETKIQNDANACALAEWHFGAARGYRNVIFLTFGTGMGAGLILNNRLYSGTNDLAGEIGHIRLSDQGPVGFGKAGSFEGFCSGSGLKQLAKMKVLEKFQIAEDVSFCEGMENLDKLNAKIVADAAGRGDELAKEIFKICGHYLGKGLSILIDILNPQIIVLGSVFARIRELLWPSALEIIEKESLYRSWKVCKIVPAGLGEEIGDYAALAVAGYK